MAALASAAILLGAAGAAAGAGGPGPLRYANATASAYTYRLPSLASCEVGDALAVVKVVGALPAHLVSLSLLFRGDERASGQRTTFEVYSFRRGTYVGQLADTFSLESLKLGKVVGAGPGATLWPLASKGLWYAVVARVKVVGEHRGPWSIEGLGVSYRAGATSYDQLFGESVRLPATPGCH